MPKLAPEKQHARREHILDAAERCFIEKGFHTTTMSDICREASVSPGALYTYFVSKDELIVGLCDREIDRFSSDLAQLAEASDFLSALQSMAEHYCCHEPHEKVRLHLEITAEASRNDVIGKAVRGMDDTIRSSFVELLERERDRGRINPELPLETIVRAMGALGDGLFLHRALDPSFDMKPIIPAMMTMVGALLTPAALSTQSGKSGRQNKR